MTARGPYYASLDAWVAQPIGSTAQYGNGNQRLMHVGAVPSSVPTDPDFKSRGLVEFSAADIAAMLADATGLDDCTLTVTVGSNECMGSRGGSIRLLCEEMTTAFAEKAVGTLCFLGSGSGAGVWGISNSVTAVNRAFHSSGAHSTGDTLTFDLSAWAAARLAASDFSAARFRLIAANNDGSGYDEANAARRIALCTREDGTSANIPQLSAHITIGTVSKTFAETGHGTDAFSVDQSGTAPSFAEVGTATDAFSAGPAGNWSTGFDADGNGRALLYIPTPATERFAALLAVDVQDIQLRYKGQLDKVPVAGSATFYLIARAMPSGGIGTDNAVVGNHYRARMTMGGNLQDISITLEKVVDGAVTALQYVSDIRAFVAQSDYWLQLQVEGVNPTVLNAKLWRWGEEEPGWMLNVEDSEPTLQAAGAVGIGGRVSSTVTNAPITLRFDQLEGFAP